MSWQGIRNGVGLAAVVCVALAWTSAAHAQPEPPPPGGGGGGFGGGGIEVDAQGVLHTRMMTDRTGQVMQQRIAAARAASDPELMASSKLRKVSLTRLERELKRRIDAGQEPSDAMRNLAGLTRVQYVFFYPEEGEIVLAGPAEGFVSDPTGRMVGVESGRAMLQLDDLIVALRAFAPSTRGASAITCSIDPTQEGLANMQQTVNQIAGSIRTVPNRQQVDQMVAALRESLGPQTVTIQGISPKTHFAKVLVEADYRMKLIALGLEQPPVRLQSYAARANPATVSANALKRWYFVPDYECVRLSDDELGIELVGESVKLVGEDEMVGADGQRRQAGRGDLAAQAFAASFTQVYPELARRSPVYGQLRNVIDLAVVAAFLHEHDVYRKTGWSLGVLADEKALPVETHHAPKLAPSACTAILRSNRLVTPVGGVHVQPRKALLASNLLADEDQQVRQARGYVKVEGLADGQWWWD